MLTSARTRGTEKKDEEREHFVQFQLNETCFFIFLFQYDDSPNKWIKTRFFIAKNRANEKQKELQQKELK